VNKDEVISAIRTVQDNPMHTHKESADSHGLVSRQTPYMRADRVNSASAMRRLV